MIRIIIIIIIIIIVLRAAHLRGAAIRVQRARSAARVAKRGRGRLLVTPPEDAASYQRRSAGSRGPRPRFECDRARVGGPERPDSVLGPIRPLASCRKRTPEKVSSLESSRKKLWVSARGGAVPVARPGRCRARCDAIAPSTAALSPPSRLRAWPRFGQRKVTSRTCRHKGGAGSWRKSPIAERA